MIGHLENSTLDYLTEGFQLIGFNWRYLYVNNAVVKQSKYSREELIGFSMMEKYPGIESTDLFITLKKCMDERFPQQIETEFTFPDNSIGWFELNIHPVPEGIFILSMDISRRKNTERELYELNERLEETVLLRTLQLESKNKDMLDSINYAKNIQKAFLPDKAEFLNLFPDAMILYKPKDIVSGDFYWYKQLNGKIIIAVADCTGHGVPGAMLSMIGIEKLNNAVLKSQDPSEILKQLNKSIKVALSQSGLIDSCNDGMDIAICSIDIINKSIKYAGANRPIWVVKKGSTEVEEIRGTRSSIGGHAEIDQEFESNDISLQPNDSLYIFSDGYADTFNGLTGKKLTTKKFKEVLLSIQGKTMHQQQKYLDDYIKIWKENVEQIDDILVLGIRI